MQVEFEKVYLKELYENGKTTEKKYVGYNVLSKKYIKCVNYLKNAPTIETLYTLKSLDYHKLEGDKKGMSAVRIDKKYRLEFIEIVNQNNIHHVEICSIKDISNHYKRK
jgi:proteic killer suppression protein